MISTIPKYTLHNIQDCQSALDSCYMTFHILFFFSYVQSRKKYCNHSELFLSGDVSKSGLRFLQ